MYEEEESAVILDDLSPHASMEALVEQDAGVAHFYLRPLADQEAGIRSCWVRNLVKAPRRLEVELMGQGVPPLMPRAECAHPRGTKPLDPETLEVVWLEAGDGAALLDSGEVLAYIPPWSGQGGFHGYAPRLHFGKSGMATCFSDRPSAGELAAGSRVLGTLGRSRESVGNLSAGVLDYPQERPRTALQVLRY